MVVVVMSAARKAKALALSGPPNIEADKPLPVAALARDVAELDTPPIRSYSTGNRELDALIGGGLSTRQLCALLGLPGAGKSAKAVSTALHIEREIPVLYACTELERFELMARFAGNVLDKPWSAIARGHTPREWTLEALDGKRIYLLGCEDMPRDGEAALALIETEGKRIAEMHGVAPLVVIDYLQDLARGSERDLRAKTGDLATTCRAMSQRLDSPMLVVSSVSRSFYSPRKAAELRALDDPQAYLAAAKESGDVDYAAAVVMFLDVDEDRSQPERAVRIAVAKSRHGQPGFAGARFAGASGRYYADAGAIEKLSAPGRADSDLEDKGSERDRKVLRAVRRMHEQGMREHATYTQLKGQSGIGTEHVKPALERLVHVGSLRLVTIERFEGDPPRTRRRDIYDLPEVAAQAPRPAEQLEIPADEPSGGLH
jgi:hypothetical protein